MAVRSSMRAVVVVVCALATAGYRVSEAGESWVAASIVMGTPSFTGNVIATPVAGGGGYLVFPLNLMYSPESDPQVELVRVTANGSTAWKRRMTMPPQDFHHAVVVQLANQDTFAAVSSQGGCVATLLDSQGTVRAWEPIDDGEGHPLECMAATETADRFVTLFATSYASPVNHQVVVRFAPHSLQHQTTYVSSGWATFERYFKDGAGNEYVTGTDAWPNPDRLFRVDGVGNPGASTVSEAVEYAPSRAAGIMTIRYADTGLQLARLGADLSTSWSHDIPLSILGGASLVEDLHGNAVMAVSDGTVAVPDLVISSHQASTGVTRWTTTLRGSSGGIATVSPSGALMVLATPGSGNANSSLMRYSDEGTLQWASPLPLYQGALALLPTGTEAMAMAMFPGRPDLSNPVIARIEADGTVGAGRSIGPGALPSEMGAIVTAADGSLRSLLRFPRGHCGVVARATDGALMWEHDFDIEWRDCAITTDDAGNTLFGGTSIEGPNDSTIRIDPMGAVSWTRNLPSNVQPSPRYMLALPGGETLVMRSPAGTTDFATTLTRLSPSGVVTGETTLANDAVPNGLWLAPDGRIFASTNARGASNSSHLWVLNADGMPAWDRELNLALMQLAFLADGSIAAIGQAPGTPGHVSLTLRRLRSANGAPVTSTILSTNGYGASAPAELDDGSVVIGFVDAGCTRVARIAANGSIGWQRGLWPQEVTWGGVAADAGRIILAGTHFSHWPPTDDDGRAFTIAIDANTGQTLWDSGLDAASCAFAAGCTSGAITGLLLQQDGSIITAGWEDHAGSARTAYVRRTAPTLFADGFER
ncbi:MAG: hypothetical protein ACTHK2_01045 [Dokdonella sp.]|uniref:hypothetical protein n=1 Tax=Dokdonella sp. TaxID=2291710 RepID=UPI003F8037F8